MQSVAIWRMKVSLPKIPFAASLAYGAVCCLDSCCVPPQRRPHFIVAMMAGVQMGLWVTRWMCELEARVGVAERADVLNVPHLLMKLPPSQQSQSPSGLGEISMIWGHL